MNSTVPHLRVVVAFCVAAVLGYAVFSVWALASGDAAMIGDVGGTWKSFAVLAFGFWLGSSSGGKAKPDEPQPVEVKNKSDEPVPMQPVAAIPEPKFQQYSDEEIKP